MKRQLHQLVLMTFVFFISTSVFAQKEAFKGKMPEADNHPLHNATAIKKNYPNSVYEKYMKEAFKPLDVYLHFWMAEIKVNRDAQGRFPIVLINDEYRKLKGKLEIRIENLDGKLVKQTEKPFEISELIADTYLIDCEYPTEPGEYVVKAIAHPENYEPNTTISTRKLKMLP
jgi:hypothetical protein